MIAIVQTPSTVPSTRQSKTPGGEYDHFRRILKTRLRFPSSADCKVRKTHFSPLKKTSSNLNFERRTLQKQEERPKTQQDIPEKQTEFYSLFNLPYKNYKYQKPPGQINVAEYLEGTYKLGKTIGIWDKKILHNKLNVNNMQIKRSTYTCDHLIKARKPQGPSSCLETIYIAKIQLENEQSEEALIKMKAMEDTLKSEISQMQIKFPSQSYILNRWTRQSVGQEQLLCPKSEVVTKFSFQKNQVNQSVETLRRSMIQLRSQENSSQMSELPQPILFYKFDPKLNSLRHLYKTKGMTVKLLQEGFPMLQKPIIGDRLLLSFGLTPQNGDQKVPYKIFCDIILIYVQKKANLKQMIDNVLNFYDPEKSEKVSISEFLNVNRILCEQFMSKHPNVKPIYDELIENFRISKVISNKIEDNFDQRAFKHVFISNQMHVLDVIELICDD